MSKTIRIEIVGDSALVDAAIDLYAKASGWTQNGQDDQIEVSRQALREYFRGIILEYQIKTAAEEASNLVREATESSLDGLGINLSVD